MIIEELEKDFKANGINMKFLNEIPADRDPNRPTIWMEHYPKAQLVLGYPDEVNDFDLAYVAYEALALARNIDLKETNPAANALQNAWVLHSVVERFGEDFRNRVIEILQWRISSLSMNEDSDEQLAYKIWSRMAAIDAFEMLRPIRQARPSVAEMIEKIQEAWHVPKDANDAFAMYQSLPVSLSSK